MRSTSLAGTLEHYPSSFPDVIDADIMPEKGLHHAPFFGRRQRPVYEYFEGKAIRIQDPVWGEEIIGDQPGDAIFFELFTNDLVKRSAGIEQLTLPRPFTTIPDTFDMSRWEHLWGSVVFARKMIDDARRRGIQIDDRAALIYQLRTFLSDLGHTAFSHLGDFLFQGFGGAENQHDLELGQLLEIGGVNDILRRHRIDPNEVNLEKISGEDWVECKSPKLCIDRVDYGMREALRYLYPTKAPWISSRNPESNTDLFQLVESAPGTLQLVMKSQDAAKQFATSFALLPTEHWGQPMHRLALYDLARLVRSVVVSGDVAPAFVDNMAGVHPRDALYSIDREILTGSHQRFSSENFEMRRNLTDTARRQRQVFARTDFGRGEQLGWFVAEFMAANDQSAPDFPDPLKHFGGDFKGFTLVPSNIDIIETKRDCLAPSGRTLDVLLPALKPRAIDPDFIDTDGEIKILSEVDPHFRKLLSQQRVIQLRNYVAQIYLKPSAIEDSRKRAGEINASWRKLLERDRLSDERLRALIQISGNLAVTQYMPPGTIQYHF